MCVLRKTYRLRMHGGPRIPRGAWGVQMRAVPQVYTARKARGRRLVQWQCGWWKPTIEERVSINNLAPGLARTSRQGSLLSRASRFLSGPLAGASRCRMWRGRSRVARSDVPVSGLPEIHAESQIARRPDRMIVDAIPGGGRRTWSEPPLCCGGEREVSRDSTR